MHHHTNRWIALVTLGAMAAATVGGPGTPAAQAGSKGRRNTTIGLGAVTAYGLLRHKRNLAIAGGVGTAIAYSRYRSAKKSEARERQARAYSRSYAYRPYRYSSTSPYRYTSTRSSRYRSSSYRSVRTNRGHHYGWRHRRNRGHHYGWRHSRHR